MQKVNICDRDITVNELSFNEAKSTDNEILNYANEILNEYQSWNSSVFEFAIDKPKLFLKLLSKSTGERKKYLKSLPAKHFDTLLFVFLSVNAEFFIQRLKLIQMAK